jgi:hypothetical protein
MCVWALVCARAHTRRGGVLYVRVMMHPPPCPRQPPCNQNSCHRLLPQEKEFIRIGYYLNNDYDDEELRNNPPATPDLARISRNILASDPRVTRFPADWDNPPADDMPVADVRDECVSAVPRKPARAGC